MEGVWEKARVIRLKEEKGAKVERRQCLGVAEKGKRAEVEMRVVGVYGAGRAEVEMVEALVDLVEWVLAASHKKHSPFCLSRLGQ